MAAGTVFVLELAVQGLHLKGLRLRGPMDAHGVYRLIRFMLTGLSVDGFGPAFQVCVVLKAVRMGAGGVRARIKMFDSTTLDIFQSRPVEPASSGLGCGV